MPPIAPAVSGGLLAAFVAYSSSFSVNLQGLRSVGASADQAASAILVLSVVMGLCGVVYSWRSRMPMNIAWSTPGAAFLAASAVPDGGFPAAVGAFLVAGLLTLLVGLVAPLARTINRFPPALANAMLAGILFDLCLAPVRAMAESPLEGGAIFLAFILVGLWHRRFAVPAAALLTVAIIAAQMPAGTELGGAGIAMPTLVLPVFELEAILGLGLPLFLVSMASQNLPGLTILRANGFEPSPRTLFTLTGTASSVVAFFGAHSVILAAITAALCAGEEAGRDRTLRYFAGISSGVAYILFGLSASVLVAFANQAPLLIAAISGLALIATFAASVKGAMEKDEHRDAAAIAFLVTASGIAFLGFSSALWGLIAGGSVLGLSSLRRRSPSLFR